MLLDLLRYPSLDAFLAAGGAEAIFPDSGDWSTRAADGRHASRRPQRRHGYRRRRQASCGHLGGVDGADAVARRSRRRAGRRRNGRRAAARNPAEPVAVEPRIRELEAMLDTATDGVVVIDAAEPRRRHEPHGGSVVRRRGRRIQGAAVYRSAGRGKPQARPRLSRRPRLERRRQRPQRWPRGHRPGAARRVDPAVHDDRPADRFRQNTAPFSATSPTGRMSRRNWSRPATRPRPPTPRNRNFLPASVTRSARRSTPSSASPK